MIRPKDIAWLVYLYPLRYVARVLPIPWLYGLQKMAARAGRVLVAGSRRKVAERLSRVLPGSLPADRIRQISDSYFAGSIRHLLDDLIMDRLIDREGLHNVEIVHREYLDEALAAGKGVLLVSGHFFAGRLAKRYLATIGYPAMAVRDHAPRDRSAGRLGREFVQKRYSRFLHSVIQDEVDAQDGTTVLKLLARLRAGGIVECHIDARASEQKIPLRFLGREQKFGIGYLQLARLAGCPVIPLLFLGDFRRLRIEFGPPMQFEPRPNPRDFAEANAEQVVRTLEQQILSHPAEWVLWAHS